jgi:hypothetical protein
VYRGRCNGQSPPGLRPFWRATRRATAPQATWVNGLGAARIQGAFEPGTSFDWNAMKEASSVAGSACQPKSELEEAHLHVARWTRSQSQAP